MRKVLTLVIVITLAATPLAGIADTDVCEQATQDAERDVKSGFWRNASCVTACLLTPLFGLGVVGLACFVKSPVASGNLLGKSSEYVTAYTDCYQEHARSIRVDEAFGGCLVGSLTYVGFMTAVAAIALAVGLTLY